MDITALLILPLVGGYIFSRTCNAIRFRTVREDGHRLYFRAAFYGAFLFAATALIRLYLVAKFPAYREWENELREVIQPALKESKGPDTWVISVICIGSLVLGAVFWVPLNMLFFWRSVWLLQAVEEDEFESLLHRALSRASPVAFTMENKKVYVGFVVKTYEPNMLRKTIRLLPLMSGFRNESGKIEFTTFYDEAYRTVGIASLGDGETLAEDAVNHVVEQDSEGETNLSLTDFEIVLPIDRVHSAGLFDINAYRHFQLLAARPRTPEELLRERKSWRGSQIDGSPRSDGQRRPGSK